MKEERYVNTNYPAGCEMKRKENIAKRMKEGKKIEKNRNNN